MPTINIPKILLPKTGDMTAWAVNACDQFTSDPEYWHSVEKLVEGKVSSYNLIYPEIYLKDDTDNRINKINQRMNEYLNGGLFREIESFILVERTTESGVRTGIVLAIDLEDYSFEKGAKTLIRSTEATILERIPPRVKIRENAPIELPHIMLLYDDKQNEVLNTVLRGDKLYDFDLNMNGGHVKGYKIENPNEVIIAFSDLLSSDVQGQKYGSVESLLFAVGDGNHSLATAKTCWDNIKASLSPQERATHPARFALCEVVNIYDPALKFEPIHRLVKTDKPDLFFNHLPEFNGGKAQVMVNGKRGAIPFDKNVPEGIRKLDNYIADFIAKNGGEVDYIHGEKQLLALSDQGVGIALPSIKKNDFFKLIIDGGNLPRKTFSMGEGNEKRYYIEAKRIK